MPGGLLIAAALAQTPPEGWRGAQRTSRVGLALLGTGAVVDGAVGIWQIARGTDPVLDGLHTGSAAALGVGIGLVAVGGLQAAAPVRRSGEPCPTWTGWTALLIESVGVGLVLADPFLRASGQEPLPGWTDWVKLGALPFAVLQVDQSSQAAARRWPDLQRSHPLLVRVSPSEIRLVGSF